jgi:hypothetical protein
VVAVFSYFTEPTVFSGRDQGSFSNAAIALSQNHGLEFESSASREFFKIYGPGKALNFPGFNYTDEEKLITHFPIGYISYLAIFYSFFGLAGFTLANAAAFFVFLLFFYLLARFYLKTSAAFVSFFLIATSFVFSWFFKFSLSENLALALVWLGVLEFIYFMKNPAQKSALFCAFLSLGLLAFVRIEAIAIILAASIILIAKAKNDNSLKVGAIFPKKYAAALILMLAVYIASLVINREFYLAAAKGFMGAFSKTETYSDGSILGNAIYLGRVMFLYSLLPYVILAALGIIHFVKDKKYSLLLPFFILMPAFIYFINPSISFDHPWMLRRFLFAAAPAAILYSTIFLDSFLKRRILFNFFCAVLLLGNLAIFLIFLPARINHDLLGQIESISRNFSADDLILIDRMATGDQWTMMAGPMNLLYGKQAVYFFNPEDLKKIDLSNFQKIYFIIPDENLTFYEKAGLRQSLIPIKDYEIENSSIFTPEQSKNEWKNNPIELPIYQKKHVYGKIYLLSPL